MSHKPQLPTPHPGEHRRLLGLVGPPGSGKSTLARRLCERANREAGAEAAAVIGVDGFHLTNAQLDARGLRSRKGAAFTFDVPALVALLRRLRGVSAPIRAPAYSRELHEPVADAILIEPHIRLVIVEGNYLLLDASPWDGVRPLLDEIWYLHTPLDTCMQRVRARHLTGGASPELSERKVAENDRPNAEQVIATRERADRIIDSW